MCIYIGTREQRTVALCTTLTTCRHPYIDEKYLYSLYGLSSLSIEAFCNVDSVFLKAQSLT